MAYRRTDHPSVTVYRRGTPPNIAWYARWTDPDTGKLVYQSLAKLGGRTKTRAAEWLREKSREHTAA